MGIVGTEASTEAVTETAAVESTLNSSASEDLSRIINAANKLGISGAYYESYTSEEDEPDQSAVNHGADYYVVIYNDDGDAYYGAIVDGDVKIWAADEVYDASDVDASKYDGNVVIKLNTPDGFSEDVDITLWCYGDSTDSDITTTTVSFAKDEDYTAGVTVPVGDCNVFDYAISGDGSEQYYVEKDTFTAKDTQSVVTVNIRQSAGAVNTDAGAGE